MNNDLNEVFFVLYLPKGKGQNDKLDFIKLENPPECILTDKIKDKEKEVFIKVFKYFYKKKKIELEFQFEDSYYFLSLSINKETFLFDLILQKSENIFILISTKSKIEQKLQLPEKMNYFIRALKKTKETDKLDILYNDSIEQYSKRPNFIVLIKIFVHIYNTNLCPKLLNVFSKNVDNIQQKDNFSNISLNEFKDTFNEIFDNSKDLISNLSLNPTDFYGLILCYLNVYNNEIFCRKFETLFQEDKNALYEVMLKYKSYFKKEINLSIDLLNEFIKFSTTKKYQEFIDNCSFYLGDVNIFFDIIERNKEDIISIEGFIPIEVKNFKNENIKDIKKIIQKIENIIQFSKNKKKLLLEITSFFWDKLKNFYSTPNKQNIEICYNIKEQLKHYCNLINSLYKDDESNKIKVNIQKYLIKGHFSRQIDKNIKFYIENNKNITNKEIINLIMSYNVYYTKDYYINLRSPEILDKINLEQTDEEFISQFKEIGFEKLFKKYIKKYISLMVNKIQKIEDFNTIINLIDEKNLNEDKFTYFDRLIQKYYIIIKKIKGIKDEEHVIKSLANLSYFLYENNKNDFFEKDITKLDKKIRHKIYIELIKKNNKKMNEFIVNKYLSTLTLENIEYFMIFINSLKPDAQKNVLKKIDNKYIICENDFYGNNKNINFELLNLLFQNNILKEESKYKEETIKVLEKIYKDIIENNTIKYKKLDLLFSNEENIIIEKMNILNLYDENLNPNDIYDSSKDKYNNMKIALNRIIKIKIALEKYHKEAHKKDINSINQMIELIKNGTYNDFYNKDLELSQIYDLEDIANQVNEVKDLKIFNIFYSNYKSKVPDEVERFEKACVELTNFKKYLIKSGENFYQNKFDDNKSESIEKIREQIKIHEDFEIQKEIYKIMNVGGEKNVDEMVNIMFNSSIYEKDIKSILYFFENFLQDKNEIEELKKKYDNLSKKKFSEITKILKELEEKKIYNYTKENCKKKSNYIKLFHYLYGKKQAFDFLISHSTDDIKALYEKIEPNYRNLTMKDITDTIDCAGFFQELKEKINLNEMIEFLRKKMEDEKLLERFKNYSDIFPSVIELYQNFDFSINLYEEVKDIIKEAKFIFDQSEEKFFYRTNNQDKEYETITIDKIRSMKNKIQIKPKGTQSIDNENAKKYNEKYDDLKFFKELASIIEDIIEDMNLLRRKGSTLPISIIIEIKNLQVKYILDKKERKLIDIQNFLFNAKNNIIEKLDITYKEKTCIRFIYGKQIDSIMQHIYGSSDNDSFLRYILNITDSGTTIKEGEKKSDRNTTDYVNEYDLYNNNSFKIINNYISTLFSNNNSSIEKHYEKILILRGGPLRGIYKHFSGSNSMEEDILQIYLDKIGKIPIAQNILISNQETSYEEMQAFFNRAILCKWNTLFVVEVNNSFSDFQQKDMINFINKLLIYKNKIFNEKEMNRDKKEVDKNNTSEYLDSCLVFVYNERSKSFIDELKQFNLKKFPLQNKHFLRQDTSSFLSKSNNSISSNQDINRTEISKNTHIYTSEICGLGKSTKIKNLIKESKKQYIYFPLGGKISKNIIYNKLKHIIKTIKTKDDYCNTFRFI